MRNLLRKVLLMLAITVIIFSLASCTLVEDMPGLVDQLLGNTDEHEHAFSDATCTTPATCECGETEGEALGHSFNEGKCACGAEDPNYVAPHEHTFVEGKCECGESDPNYVPPHTHNFVEGKCECGESDPNYVPPHTHNFVEGKCECGESDPNYVPPHTHTFVEGKCECGAYDHEHECEENTWYHPELVSATCTTPGVAVFECTLCDYYYTEATEIDPEAHEWDYTTAEVLTPADCSTMTSGVLKLTCSACEETKEEELYAMHELEKTVVDATCTENGSYYAVCTVCGYEESNVIEAEGHFNWYLACEETGACMECGEEFTAAHNTVWSPATCTEAAYCWDCESYVGEPLGHTFVEGKCECGEEDPDYVPCEHEYEENTWYHPELVSATCTTPGVAVFECTLCDYYYTEATEIDPEAHEWDYTTAEVLTPADCETMTSGVLKLTCSACEETKEEELYAMHELEKTVVDATCTENGSYYAVCTVCGHEESEVINAEGHFNWYLACEETGACMECGEEFTAAHNTVWSPATCTEAAYCWDCESYVGGPLGHTPNVEAATCATAQVCTVCEETLAEKLEEHTPGAEATCAAAQTCTVCGETLAEKLEEHTPGAEATCIAAQTCTVCGETLVAKLDHTPGAEATCTAAQTCTACSETLVAKLDHKDDDNNCLCDYKCGTITNYGTLEAPLTAAQANAIGATLGENEYTAQKVYVTGTVTSIASVGNYYSKVYITDGSSSFYIYSINLGTGITGFTKTDVIVAYGYIQNYGGDTIEMTGKSGDYPYALAVVDSCAAGHDFTDATCTTPKTCKVCDTTEGEVLPHEYVNGVCSCGAKEPTGAETTVSFTAKDAADQEGWTNSTKYSTLVYDGVTFTAAGSDANTGKYYTSGGGSWRFYSSGNATLTITVPEGASIKSVKITWSEGGLSCNGTAMKSGTVFNVEGNSVVIKATAKTFITAIEVVYA